jgi:hypothetical protein
LGAKLGVVSVKAFFVASAVLANAAPPIPDCTVEKKCSSTGLECVAGDRNCSDEARQKELEVTCERGAGPYRHFVYCPPNTARTDSKGMWIMLVAAVGVAIIGGGVLALAIRKKPA